MLKIHTKSNEIWKDIEGYEGLYQISNFGRVKSLSRLNHCGHKGSKPLRINEYIRKPQITPKGYLNIKLSKDGVSYNKSVHRLILMTFKPIEDMDTLDVNHKDGVKHNNKLINLEWMTRSENVKHSFENGLQDNIAGVKTYSYDEKQFIKNNLNMPTKEIAKILNRKVKTINKYKLEFRRNVNE